MPGEIRRCFICDRTVRGAKSLYMIIDCLEQERRIKNGYLKRYKREIRGSILNKQIHRVCYRSIIRNEPLAVVRSTTNPQKYYRSSNQNTLKIQRSNLPTHLSPSLHSAVIDKDLASATASNINVTTDPINAHIRPRSSSDTTNDLLQQIPFDCEENDEVCFIFEYCLK